MKTMSKRQISVPEKFEEVYDEIYYLRLGADNLSQLSRGELFFLGGVKLLADAKEEPETINKLIESILEEDPQLIRGENMIEQLENIADKFSHNSLQRQETNE